MSDSETQLTVQVTAATVLRGDIIVVGGQQLRVLDMVSLPMGGKRLTFTTGETLTLHQHSVLTAARMVRRTPRAAWRPTTMARERLPPRR